MYFHLYNNQKCNLYMLLEQNSLNKDLYTEYNHHYLDNFLVHNLYMYCYHYKKDILPSIHHKLCIHQCFQLKIQLHKLNKMY
jgi:hypothetical protein